MRGDTDKCRMIGNIGNRINQFRITVEQNLNIHFDEII